MLALSIRQPFAELILRGIKTTELRAMPTKIVGRRFYIYACKTKSTVYSRQSTDGLTDDCRLRTVDSATWSDDLQIGQVPGWMIELARQVRLIPADADLPTGVIVGSAVIESVEEVGSRQSTVGSRQQNRVYTGDLERQTVDSLLLASDRCETPRQTPQTRAPAAAGVV